MSQDPEILQPSIQKKHKKIEENDVAKKDRKRKRDTYEDAESLKTAKKHRSVGHLRNTKAKVASEFRRESVDESPFYEKSYSLFLPLSPISYQHPIQGLCAEHLSPLILTYYPPFHGVILSYTNPRLSRSPQNHSSAEKTGPILAKSVDEYAVSFVWVTAVFCIFRPRKNNRLEGWINLQSEGNLGLVCWNFFNVSIERSRLPKNWRWVHGSYRKPRKHKGDRMLEDPDHEEGEKNQPNSGDAEQGYFADKDGHKVEGLIQFRVINVESSRTSDREKAFMRIEGSILDEEAKTD